MHNLIVILGPTASGKTKLAVQVASELHSEIISADSRQVYKGMDIGTGKDLEEYVFQGKVVPYHLIDIRSAGDHYHVADFQKDFSTVFERLSNQGIIPIFCGGSGMYIDAVLKNYQYTSIPVNKALREELDFLSLNDLMQRFEAIESSYTASADTSTRKRLIRAIEISAYLQSNPLEVKPQSLIKPIIFGLDPPVEERRKRISDRLLQRLNQGLIEEVKGLLQQNVPSEKLMFYGLEYKFVTEYLQEKIAYNEMVDRLTIAIQQFAKRQMTYFRKMERDGFNIHWLDTQKSTEENTQIVLKSVKMH